MKVYLNGRIVREKEAKLSVLDSGFLLGDGLFETIRAYEGKIFLLKEHLERLFSSAKFLNLKIPVSKKKLAEACYETIRANHLKEARLRLTISQGGKGSIILITAVPLPQKVSSEPEQIKLVKCDFSLARNFPLAKHKTLSYLPYLYAYQQAQKKGADDALIFTEEGILLEASRANIFLVQEGVLKTPSLNLPILPGITRAKIIELAKKLGVKVQEGEFREKDLLESDQAFLTNSIIELKVVKQYQAKIFHRPEALELIKKLLKAYRHEAQRANYVP